MEIFGCGCMIIVESESWPPSYKQDRSALEKMRTASFETGIYRSGQDSDETRHTSLRHPNFHVSRQLGFSHSRIDRYEV